MSSISDKVPVSEKVPVRHPDEAPMLRVCVGSLKEGLVVVSKLSGDAIELAARVKNNGGKALKRAAESLNKAKEALVEVRKNSEFIGRFKDSVAAPTAKELSDSTRAVEDSYNKAVEVLQAATSSAEVELRANAGTLVSALKEIDALSDRALELVAQPGEKGLIEAANLLKRADEVMKVAANCHYLILRDIDEMPASVQQELSVSTSGYFACMKKYNEAVEALQAAKKVDLRENVENLVGTLKEIGALSDKASALIGSMKEKASKPYSGSGSKYDVRDLMSADSLLNKKVIEKMKVANKQNDRIRDIMDGMPASIHKEVNTTIRSSIFDVQKKHKKAVEALKLANASLPVYVIKENGEMVRENDMSLMEKSKVDILDYHSIDSSATSVLYQYDLPYDNEGVLDF